MSKPTQENIEAVAALFDAIDKIEPTVKEIRKALLDRGYRLEISTDKDGLYCFSAMKVVQSRTI